MMSRTMKSIIFLTLLHVAYLQPVDDWKEKAKEMQEKYEKIREFCAGKLEMSVQSLRKLEWEAPNGRQERCALECIFTEAGLMADGKYSKKGTDVVAEFLFDDDELDSDNLQIAREISRRCEKEVEKAKLDDGCDTANKIFLCLRRISKHVSFKETGDYY